MKLFAEGQLYELLNTQGERMCAELLSQRLSDHAPGDVHRYLAALLAQSRLQPLVFNWERAQVVEPSQDRFAPRTVTYRVPFGGTPDLLWYAARPLDWLRKHALFVDADGYIEQGELCFDLVEQPDDPDAVQHDQVRIEAFVRDEVPHINKDIADFNDDLPLGLRDGLDQFFVRLPLNDAAVALLTPPPRPHHAAADAPRGIAIQIDTLSPDELDAKLQELGMPQDMRDQVVRDEQERRAQRDAVPFEPSPPLHIDDLLPDEIDDALRVRGVTDLVRHAVVAARKARNQGG